MTARKPKNGDRVQVKMDGAPDHATQARAVEAFNEQGADSGGHFEDVGLSAVAKDGTLTYEAVFVAPDVADEPEATVAQSVVTDATEVPVLTPADTNPPVKAKAGTR